MKEIIFSLITFCSPAQPEQFVQVCGGDLPTWVKPSSVACVHPEPFHSGKDKKTMIILHTGEQFMVGADVKHVINALNGKENK